MARSPSRKARVVRYFSVKLRMLRQVAGQRRGLQTINDRILQFEARSEAEARRRALKYGKLVASPYHEQDGTLVRWTTTILEVQRSSGTVKDLRVRVVWNGTGRRRVKRGSGWNP